MFNSCDLLKVIMFSSTLNGKIFFFFFFLVVDAVRDTWEET